MVSVCPLMKREGFLSCTFARSLLISPRLASSFGASEGRITSESFSKLTSSCARATLQGEMATPTKLPSVSCPQTSIRITGSARVGDQLTESGVPAAAPLKACASSARTFPDSPTTVSSTLHTGRESLTSSLWPSRST